MKKIIRLMSASLCAMLILMLAGCKTSDVQEVADQIKELNEMMDNSHKVNDFKNPENVVDYLKDKDVVEEEPEEEIEDPGYIAINLSEGYDSNGKAFAVKVDATGEEILYSIIDIEEARGEGAKVSFETDFYGKIADSIIEKMTVFYDGKDTSSGEIPLNDEELRNAIMQSAEGLLYVEYYEDGKRVDDLYNLLNQLNYLIYESADVESDDLMLSYNLSAILAKASYDLEDFTAKKEAIVHAEKLWQDAELKNNDNVAAEINRAWAAAELYRVTGAKTYRTIVEAVSGDIELRGLSFEEPGYYAIFAYLSADKSTSYDISNRMMKFFLADINGRIKTTTEDLLNKSIKDMTVTEDSSKLSNDFINSAADEATLAMMANYITMSVEYTRYAEDRLLFLLGANPTGENFLNGNNTFDMDSTIFALCALSK